MADFKFNFTWTGNEKPADKPYMSISRRGLVLSNKACELLGNPQHILIGFDSTSNAFGVMQASSDDSRAIELHRNSNMKNAAKSWGKCTAKYIYRRFPDAPEIKNVLAELADDVLVAKIPTKK